MAEDLELPDEVFGFGSWLLWLVATRATALVDRAYETGPARPSKKFGMVDGHHVPTPALIAWFLTAAAYGMAPDGLAHRGPALDERQKVLRTLVSRAIGGESRGGESRLFKDAWLHDLARLCGLSEQEREFLLSSRDDARYVIDHAALRAAIGHSLRSRLAAGLQVAGVATATRTLPRDIGSFTGRETQMLLLAAAADQAAESGAMVSIHAIGGMAGIGKTAFAVHAAHRLAPRFPDGQIFLPLHAHTPGQQSVAPQDALASLLQISGFAPARIPDSLESRMALWRDHSANKQLLLLLDDAAGHDQVRPLLPGSTRSLVLITSRRHLTALEDARPISLDTLAPGEAATLLVRLADQPGLDPGDPAVAQITRLCDYLPLAIGMLARQLHHHPAWTAASLAADLAAERDRLQLMAAENLSVAAAFDLSYADLTEAQQQMFRRLGLHPGTDIDAYAAAALDGTDLSTARHQLDALYDHYLVTEPAHGWYRLHDLIREHARSKADTDPGNGRYEATGRLFGYYLQCASTAETRLARQSRTRPEAAAAPAPPVVPDLSGDMQALSWTRAQRGNLLACLGYAAGTGQHDRVAGLTAALAPLLRRDGPWADAIARHTAAVEAARHLDDRLTEANALSDLGDIRYLTGDYHGAAETQQEALVIYRTLGDRLGQANALADLGVTQEHTGAYPAAAGALEEALAIYRDLRDERGQANALSIIGMVREHTGEYPRAAGALAEALAIYRKLGHRQGQAVTLLYLAAVRRLTGDYRSAAGALDEALAIYRELGERLGQANALLYLGEVRKDTGDSTGAADALAEALGLYRDLGQRQGQANVLNYLGALRRITQDYQAAAGALDEALVLYRDLGDLGGEVQALNELGATHRASGMLPSAQVCHEQALELARRIDSPWDEAHALAGLGRCLRADGRATEARSRLEQARRIFERIGAVEASEIAAELGP